VLADDPGSAVLTLTSFGMVQRSRPHRRDVSPIVALWRDHSRGFREIPLEPGAHGVVLTVCMDRATRRSADGRWPVDNGTRAFDVAVNQVRASTAGSRAAPSVPDAPAEHLLEVEELTVLTAWAEAVAEALAHAPERACAVLAEAQPGAAWRTALGLDEPSQKLSEAIDAMDRTVRAASPPGNGRPGLQAIATALQDDQPGEPELDTLVRRALLAMIEQRATRQPEQAGHQ
jgi:hypothetical protein